MENKIMVAEGRYNAKPINWAIGESKKGSLQAMISFRFSDYEGKTHTLTWFGSFNEGKAREITLKTLLYCGLKNNDVEKFAEGLDGDALDINSEVEIDVAHEQGEDGKWHAKVKWVNQQGGMKFKNMLIPSDAKNKLRSLNLKGELMQIKQKFGIQEPVKKVVNFDDDDGGEIPF